MRAFWFPPGAPDSDAPPCMRQRLLPRTAGERHDLPERIFAPHRGLASIGPVVGAYGTVMPGNVVRVGELMFFSIYRRTAGPGKFFAAQYFGRCEFAHSRACWIGTRGTAARTFCVAGRLSILSRQRQNAGNFGYMACPSAVRLNANVLGSR